MRLSAVMFLSWTAFLGLFDVASPSPPPGILVRLTYKGLQTAVDVASKRLKSRINQGMHVPDMSGSFRPGTGHLEYFLTEVEVKECSLDEVTVRINPGTGVTISIGKIQALIGGKFRYKYTIMYIPTWNSGTFSVTTSDVSLCVEVTVRMNPDGQPIVDFPSCTASIGNIGLTFEAKHMNWLLGRLTKRLKDKMKPTLQDAICDAIRNGRDRIEKELAKNIKPCLDSACNCRIDLCFVSHPVFGENFIETGHRGEVFCKNDTGLAPFEPIPFQPLPLSSKMAELYVSPYVFNTAMRAMHQNELLSYKFTKYDLPDTCPNALDTSCKRSESLCIRNVLPNVFGSFPNASVELYFFTISPPFMSISSDSLSVTIHVHANVSIRNLDGSIIAERLLTLRGSYVALVFINPNASVDFTVTDVNFVNATISDKDTETDLFEIDDSYVISRLQLIAKICILPKIITLRQISVKTVGGFHTANRSLELIPNAFAFTADGFDSNGI